MYCRHTNPRVYVFVLVNTWPHIKSFGQCERGNQEPVISIMSCCHVMSIGKLSQVPIWVWG